MFYRKFNSFFIKILPLNCKYFVDNKYYYYSLSHFVATKTLIHSSEIYLFKSFIHLFNLKKVSLLDKIIKNTNKPNRTIS